MNPKTKADLQRKLTLAQVPKPPADLADRIKRDIPPHLVMGVSSDRARFNRSIFFDMRVAASVLLLVTSAFFALQFFSRVDHAKIANFEPRPGMRAIAQPATLTAETASASEPLQVARLEPPVTRQAEMPSIVNTGRAKDRREAAPTRNEPLLAYDAVQEARPLVADATPEPPIAREEISVPAPAAAPAPAPVLGGTFGYMAEAKASDIAMPQRAESVFGISVDQRAFERIKSAIEHGAQPESASIDVAALVNYFAGSAKRETHDVRLDAEGSTAPVVSDAARRMVRMTIDTATAELAPGASTPPVATEASLEVEFDKSAVAAFHLVGGDGSLHSTIEPTLLKNTSVTALYDIELVPRGTSWQRVATFRLKYKSVTDGRQITLEKTLRRRDLEKTWIAASRRHRLASLGAVWGETLKGMAGANDVARRAEELALQAPEDAKARELADVANATSQLRGSASGSAR